MMVTEEEVEKERVKTQILMLEVAEAEKELKQDVCDLLHNVCFSTNYLYDEESWENPGTQKKAMMNRIEEILGDLAFQNYDISDVANIITAVVSRLS